MTKISSGPMTASPDPGLKDTQNLQESPFSVFHSEWWLDAVTGGQWGRCEVRENGKIVGGWPYFIKHRLGLKIAVQPTLTRSLGPFIKRGRGKAVGEFRREGEILGELIGQLPHVNYLNQTLDTKSTLGVHFKNAGFTCSLDYTIRTPSGRTADQLWSEMRDKTRNLIRNAQNTGITAAEIKDPDEFCAFYADRLEARKVKNVYSSDLMKKICHAAVLHQSGTAIGAYSSSGHLQAAIFTIWDKESSYYLLSCRTPEAHSGAVSLLLWQGMQEAAAAGRSFDFDGTPTPAVVRFLTGFSANAVPRVQVVRGGTVVRLAHTVSRLIASRAMFKDGSNTDVMVPL